MTQKDKQLLLIDLCARLPYGVKFKADNEKCIREIHYIKDEDVYIREYRNLSYWIDTIKPYLRPMSSMTEEEQIELGRLIGTASYNMLKGNMSHLDALLVHIYKNHIDVFGLIDQGLALEAPEGMYNLNEK